MLGLGNGNGDGLTPSAGVGLHKVVLYQSDFSSGLDGWSLDPGYDSLNSLEYGQTSPSGLTDSLEHTVILQTTGGRNINNRFSVNFPSGTIRYGFDVEVDVSGQDHSFRLKVGSAITSPITATADTTTVISGSVLASDPSTLTISFQGLSSGMGSSVFFKNILLYHYI